MYFDKKEFKEIINDLYVQYDIAPEGVPGVLVMFHNFYAVFETYSPVKKPRELYFHPKFYNALTDREGIPKQKYKQKYSNFFLSENEKKDTIKKYSELNFIIDDLSEYPFLNVCLWCGEPLKGQSKLYCSKKCGIAFRALCESDFYHLVNLNNDGYITDDELEKKHNEIIDQINKQYIYKKCPVCGAPITRSNAKFCSDKCRFDYHNEQKKKKKSG